MTPQRIGKLRNVGKGIEGNIRIDGRMHRITVVPNPRKQNEDDADMFVLLVPPGLPRDTQAIEGYETKN
jgi:hypothetical protein